jgi:hypothetical protein
MGWPLIKIKTGVPEQRDPNVFMSYETFREHVNWFLVNCRGVSIDDLADCPLRDWYDEGIRPIYAANRALEFDQRMDLEE